MPLMPPLLLRLLRFRLISFTFCLPSSIINLAHLDAAAVNTRRYSLRWAQLSWAAAKTNAKISFAFYSSLSPFSNSAWLGHWLGRHFQSGRQSVKLSLSLPHYCRFISVSHRKSVILQRCCYYFLLHVVCMLIRRSNFISCSDWLAGG